MKTKEITLYCKEQDFCFVVDCYGYYDKVWQLSSNFVTKGMEIVAVGDSNKFLNGNMTFVDYKRLHDCPRYLQRQVG